MADVWGRPSLLIEEFKLDGDNNTAKENLCEGIDALKNTRAQ